MNCVVDSPAIVHENDVAADNDVTPASRRRRKSADEFSRRGVRVPTHVAVDDVSFPESRVIPIVMTICVSESPNVITVAIMCAIPVASDLLIVIVETFVVISIAVVMVLSADGAGRER